MKRRMSYGSDPWIDQFENLLDPEERQLLSGIDTPPRIQAFLDSVPYSEEHFYRCPVRLLRERKGHCFDGALFAAIALRRMGHQPLILELIPNERDDDHILALFKEHGCWGAIAQSNFSGLRYREPVYRNLRELVMSYFENFFNSAGEKTLTGYRGPINLKTFDGLDWCCNDAGLLVLADRIDNYLLRPVITEEMAASLSRVDERSLNAGMVGTNPRGLFKVS